MNNNYNYGYTAQPKKKKSKLGLIIIILFVIFQIIIAVSTLSDDYDTSTVDDFDSDSNKNFEFPDYPDFNSYNSSNSSSQNSNTSSTNSDRYNTSSATSSYNTNSYYGNNTSSTTNSYWGNTSSVTSSYTSNSSSNNNYGQNGSTNNNTNSNNSDVITNFNGYLYKQLNNDEKTIYSTVVNTVARGGLTCSFSNVSNLTQFKKDVSDAILAVTYEFPELFWISGDYKYRSQKAGSTYNITLELKCFDYWKYTSNPQKYVDNLRNAVKKIANSAKAYNTDFERVQYVHDYIAKTVEYNYDAADEADKTVRKASSEQAFSAYGCLVDGNAICGGYSKGFQLVLKELGIECIYLTGYAGEYHAWNCVKLDGEYYFFDVTWDDPTIENNGKVLTDTVMYNYFGVTSQQMSKDHKVLENFKFPTCVATKYNYFQYKGFVLDKYNFNEFDKILNKQPNQLIVSVKFTSLAELNKAKADLIDNYKWTKLKLFGGKTVKYNCDKDKLEFRFYRY